jgi:hypothetical protein
MKKLAKKMLLAVSLMAVSGLVLAHTASGTLGKTTTSTAATDVYSVNCYDDDEGAGVPTKLFLHVKSSPAVKTQTNLPKVSIMGSKGGSSVTSTVAANNNVYSAVKTLAKGDGYYGIYVTKPAGTVKGVVSYTAEFHCQAANGAHAGTDFYQTQNQ